MWTRKIIKDLIFKMDSLEKQVRTIADELFALKNKPKFKPYDKVIVNYPIFPFPESSKRGIVVTKGIAKVGNFIYQINIDDKIQTIREPQLMLVKKLPVKNNKI